MRSVLLAGLGAANSAVAQALLARNHTVTVFDDAAGPKSRAVAAELGLDLIVAPDHAHIFDLVAEADVVIPTPGLPESHQVLVDSAASNTEVISELDLAHMWDKRPIAAVTGTNGKTTVTDTVVCALNASGVSAMAAGNNDIPLVTAIERPDVDVFVVEASSFRLAHSQRFAPQVGCWLNFAPDHLDVHRSLGSYEAAKARIWRNFGGGDVAVANTNDVVVMRNLPADATVCTFSISSPADWQLLGNELVGPSGVLCSVNELRRRRPHDLSNALAVAATAIAAGASTDGVRQALRHYEPGPHRLQRVAVINDVPYFNDSKATTPHATVAALRGYEAAVLVAGGRNKGLDLTELAEAADHIHTVIAFGESADEIFEIFADLKPVAHASDMDEAVSLAAAVAEPSMAVLLSPACASYDAYSNYAERGNDFARAVNELAGRLP